MKFRCEREVLLEALGTAQRAVASKGAFPALSGVQLVLQGDSLQVTGTDLDLFVRLETTVAGQSDGIVVVPAKLAADIVRTLDEGAVQVEADDDGVRITSGRSNFSLRTFDAADFPRQPEPAQTPVSLPVAELTEALRQVVRAASNDIGSPLLTGVQFLASGDGLKLIATDKYRLAVRDLAVGGVLAEGQSVIIPSRALSELQRLLNGLKPPKPVEGEEPPAAAQVSIRLGEHDATFDVGTTRLTTRLIPGSFPPYQRLLIDSYPNRLLVGKEPLLEALRRVRLLVDSTISPVRLQLAPGTVTLTVHNADKGVATDEVDATYEGSELLVAFNPEYLAQGIDAIAGDEVQIDLLDGVKQATVTAPTGTADHEGFLYLLMPHRI